MATIKPFAALRPNPELAARICELPYDVMSTSEARQLAAGNPLSFLHVSKPEIDLPMETNPYAPEVYRKGMENFQKLRAQGALRLEAQPALYLYRQAVGSHQQVGLVAVASCEDYLDGVIKKHELTRPDKEDDRVRHIEALGAQTGPVFLVYRSVPRVDALVAKLSAGPPDVDFTAVDSVRHSAWTVRDPGLLQVLEQEFSTMSSMYIADGHHRSAAAARVYRTRAKQAAIARSDPSGFFLSVIFPHDQVRILPYHRVLKDLNGLAPRQLLNRLEEVFTLAPNSSSDPAREHELGLYIAGRWHTLRFLPCFADMLDPIERLDVTLLQKLVLEPVFGIADARTSKRINFVGGVRGTGELARLVDSGEYACAFSLFPTRIQDLMTIADAGGIMPPKSTWFEPKLRDAMFCHLI